MNKYQAGIITLLALGAAGCSNDYMFDGQMSRKDDKGQMVQTDVKIGNEFKVTLTSYHQPVLIENIEGITNKYYINSFDDKKWGLEEVVVEGFGDMPPITKDNNPKAFNRAQQIVNDYKNDYDARVKWSLR